MYILPELPRALPGYEHIRRYWDHHHGKYMAKILPGEFYISRNDEILSTVLGSCVAACIRDEKAGIGGMNHFMLPIHIVHDEWEDTAVSATTRYGNVAMEELVNEILKFGGRRENLEVKIFGGGTMMSKIANIGKQNIDFVREYILTEGLRLIAEDVGDFYPRKILFYPLTGLARVKKLRSIEESIINRERAYQRTLEEQTSKNKGGDVELF
jgi:chemotaxis protein CheD